MFSPRAERQLDLRRSCLAAEGSLLPLLETLLLTSVRDVVAGGAPHARHWGERWWYWPLVLAHVPVLCSGWATSTALRKPLGEVL